jgi:hypothetical protein
MNSTIDPLKGYNEGQLRELLNLKKRYMFAARSLVSAETWELTSTSASRWCVPSRPGTTPIGWTTTRPDETTRRRRPERRKVALPPSPSHAFLSPVPLRLPPVLTIGVDAEKANRARQKFDESRTAYFNRLVHRFATLEYFSLFLHTYI